VTLSVLLGALLAPVAWLLGASAPSPAPHAQALACCVPASVAAAGRAVPRRDRGSLEATSVAVTLSEVVEAACPAGVPPRDCQQVGRLIAVKTVRRSLPPPLPSLLFPIRVPLPYSGHTRLSLSRPSREASRRAAAPALLPSSPPPLLPSCSSPSSGAQRPGLPWRSARGELRPTPRPTRPPVPLMRPLL
jgi:hypothetical protein